MSTRLLLLEDDPAIARTVAYTLERDGLQVTHCLLVQDARQQMQRHGFDLLVLDVGLPDGSGLDLLRDVRHGQAAAACACASATPGADAQRPGRGAGPRAGPGTGRRRLPGQALQPARAGRPHQGPAAPRRHARARRCAAPAFCHDETGQRITLHGQALPLTRREYRLLSHLLRGAGRIHTRDALLAAAWGDDSESTDRTVDTHIKTLRAKLREVDAGREYISTHRGMGYCLEPV
jgi:two-component system catabolic regulation response regulator CreB